MFQGSPPYPFFTKPWAKAVPLSQPIDIAFIGLPRVVMTDASRFLRGEEMAEISRLPGPIAHQWSWQESGACRRLSPDAFFHPEGERGAARIQRATAAKRVCGGCPVLAQCRSHALAAREPYGIWGGMTEEERVAATSTRVPMSA